MLEGCMGMNGPGKYSNPSEDAFPYDEAFLTEWKSGIYYAAFRIGNKWGIERISYSGNIEDTQDTEGYKMRKIIVPCEFNSLEAAQSQILHWIDLSKAKDHSFLFLD